MSVLHTLHAVQGITLDVIDGGNAAVEVVEPFQEGDYGRERGPIRAFLLGDTIRFARRRLYPPGLCRFLWEDSI